MVTRRFTHPRLGNIITYEMKTKNTSDGQKFIEVVGWRAHDNNNFLKKRFNLERRTFMEAQIIAL